MLKSLPITWESLYSEHCVYFPSMDLVGCLHLFRHLSALTLSQHTEAHLGRLPMQSFIYFCGKDSDWL